MTDLVRRYCEARGIAVPTTIYAIQNGETTDVTFTVRYHVVFTGEKVRSKMRGV